MSTTTAAARCSGVLPPRLRLFHGAVINRQDLLDLPSLLAGADANPQRCAGADGLPARSLQRVHMQEHVAGTIGQRREAEALLRVNHFTVALTSGADDVDAKTGSGTGAGVLP